MKDWFETYHPAVNAIYFLILIGITAFIMHPILTGISFVGAVIYEVYIDRMSGVKRVCSMIPVFLLTAIINPLFSHRGVTLICYLPTGNPVTMESVIFGLNTGLMIVTVLIWFIRISDIMTGDRIINLLAGSFPTIAMIISFVMGFIPRTIEQYRKIRIANRALGMGNKSKVKEGMLSFSSLTSWALENSVTTAQSMKARGYGSCKRIKYSNRNLDTRDKVTLGFMGLLTVVIMAGIVSKKVGFTFYPYLELKEINESVGVVISLYVAFTIFILIPFLINLLEDIQWRKLKSKI